MMIITSENFTIFYTKYVSDNVCDKIILIRDRFNDQTEILQEFYNIYKIVDTEAQSFFLLIVILLFIFNF